MTSPHRARGTSGPVAAGAQARPPESSSVFDTRDRDYLDRERIVVFSGRTGCGTDIEVHTVGDDWIEVLYRDPEGDRAGFALNALYTSHLVEALVGVLARRSRG